ncbi:hypothetical protein BJY52DRAFT_1251034 [Lactarius psammicola]|nr:hypothetical protein BJY52DRAFT_1251034 [Lactarius psammicola]
MDAPSTIPSTTSLLRLPIQRLWCPLPTLSITLDSSCHLSPPSAGRPPRMGRPHCSASPCEWVPISILGYWFSSLTPLLVPSLHRDLFSLRFPFHPLYPLITKSRSVFPFSAFKISKATRNTAALFADHAAQKDTAEVMFEDEQEKRRTAESEAAAKAQR